MKKQKIKHEYAIPFEKAVAALEDWLDGMKSGPIVIEKNDEKLTLTPQDIVKVSIKAKKEDGEESLTFKLSWKEPDENQIPAVKTPAELAEKTPSEVVAKHAAEPPATQE